MEFFVGDHSKRSSKGSWKISQVVAAKFPDELVKIKNELKKRPDGKDAHPLTIHQIACKLLYQALSRADQENMQRVKKAYNFVGPGTQMGG